MPTYKMVNKNTYSRLPDKLAEETPQNKLCAYIIGPYKIRIKGRDTLILKAVTMRDPLNRWFEVT